MPIYDYRCRACGHEVEVIHGIDGSGPETCTLCGGEMRKALSAPAIHFKGSGWAKKDARDAGAAKASQTSTGGGTPDTGSGAKGGGADKDAAGTGDTATADAGVRKQSSDDAGSQSTTGDARAAAGTRSAAD